MYQSIEEYLDIMCAQILNERAREEARLEMENHLLDQVKDRQIKFGESAGEALVTILSEATDPKKLGKSLNKAHKPFWLRYPIILGATLASTLSVISLIILSNYLVEYIFIPKLEDTTEFDNANIDIKFRADLDIINKYKWHGFERWNNAHEYLVTHLPSDPMERLPLQNRYFFTDWYKSEKKLKKFVKTKEIQGLDTNWINNLLMYDHWNIFSNYQLRKKINDTKNKGSVAKIGLVASIAFPNQTMLRHLTVIHAVKLIETGQVEQAEKSIDHISRLLISTNTLIGWLTSSVLLKTKNNLIQFYDLKSWNVIPDELILAYKRAGWGWAGVFARYSVQKDNLEWLEDYMRPELGMCVGMAEFPLGRTYLSDFMYESAPFERDYRSEIKSSAWQTEVRLRKCDMDDLTDLVSIHSPELDLFDGTMWQMFVVSDGWPSNWMRYIPINPAYIPYVRRIVGFYLNTVAIPQYFRVYTKEI